MPTIKTWLQALGRKRPWNECPYWPPDLYAITGALLKRTGAYLRVFQDRRWERCAQEIMKQGDDWQTELDKMPDDLVPTLMAVRPPEVQKSWKILINAAAGTSLSQVQSDDVVSQHLIRLALIADQASAGIGVDWPEDRKKRRFLNLAELVKSDNELRSFCLDVSPDVLCVLGKQHTPQIGATFRSLTHHLSLYLPNEIEARWHGPYGPPKEGFQSNRMLNLLLLPWPLQIDSGDFRKTDIHERATQERPVGDYFQFRRKTTESDEKFTSRFRNALREARRQTSQINAIVLPELALTKHQFDLAERVALKQGSMLISGVRIAESPRDSNLIIMQPAGVLDPPDDGMTEKAFVDAARFSQAKHHRWCLNREQIVNYQLGGQLSASRLAWENIHLPPRVLYFTNIDQLTWSILICEDLARQDPAADLIRAVGPNLLIALLMDGPQLRGRWPSRYASVLADDPGTSVLTLTSLGMALRSRPLDLGTGKRSGERRVIALWRDVQAGEIEIELEPDDDACVLSLECCPRTEYSADGRVHLDKPTPVYAGYKSIRTGA